MNLAWAKEWFGSLSAGMEKFNMYYADDVQFEDLTFAVKCNGIAELKQFFSGFSAPGAGEHVFTVTGYSGGADGGAVEWNWQAKHDSDFLGVPAKGKQTTVKGVSILTFKGGKITSQHDYWDANTVLQQLKK
ncbi:MAG TPA: ester cyclase [Candidatus Binatia bacterium]|nr:ester cyclase [Candidatus Binatia bacterium]